MSVRLLSLVYTDLVLGGGTIPFTKHLADRLVMVRTSLLLTNVKLLYSEGCKMAIRVVKRRIFNQYINIVNRRAGRGNEKRVWTRNSLLRRDTHGVSVGLLRDLASNRGSSIIQTILRIKPIQFKCLLRKVSSIIPRADTCHKFTINLELIKKNLFHKFIIGLFVHSAIPWSSNGNSPSIVNLSCLYEVQVNNEF